MTGLSYCTRRGFLRALLGVGFFVFTRPAHFPGRVDAAPAHDPLALRLANVFGRKESARVVGREYLRSVPQEADAGILVDLLCSCRAQGYREFSQAQGAELRELLRLQQREDFERGCVVNLQGWILSQTEVRLCALAAIL
jgi:hypothetical protein